MSDWGVFRRWLGHARYVFGNRMTAKVLDLVVILVAGNTLGDDALGTVFSAQATAAIAGGVVGLGLYAVIARRAARESLGRRALGKLVVLRGLTLAGASVVGLIGARLALPDQWGIFFGFLLVSGMDWVHEPGRAALAGRERFGLTMAFTAISRALGTAIAVGSLLYGFGLAGWLVGRAIDQLLQTGLVTRAALRELPEQTQGAPVLELVREARPFWVGYLVHEASGQRVYLLAIGSLLGLGAAGVYGVASRVVFAIMVVVGSLASAAFPRWTRTREGPIGRPEVLTFVGIAALSAVGLLAGAPIPAALLLPADAEQVTLLIRVLAFAGAASAVHLPLQYWLQARDHEVAVTRLRVVSAIAGLAAIVPCALLFGLVGAAGAALLDHAVLLAGLVYLVRQVSGARPPAPRSGGP